MCIFSIDSGTASLTAIEQAVARSYTDLLVGNASAKAIANTIVLQQVTDLGFDTSQINKSFNAIAALSLVLTANPTAAQKIEISKKLVDARQAEFALFQPGFVELMSNPIVTGDAKNAEFIALASQVDSIIESLIADPTNALNVFTTQLNVVYTRYLTKLKEFLAQNSPSKCARYYFIRVKSLQSNYLDSLYVCLAWSLFDYTGHILL